jgi:hypothetical protein
MAWPFNVLARPRESGDPRTLASERNIWIPACTGMSGVTSCMAGQLRNGTAPQCHARAARAIHVFGSSQEIDGTGPAMKGKNLALKFGILRANIEGRSFHGT